MDSPRRRRRHAPAHHCRDGRCGSIRRVPLVWRTPLSAAVRGRRAASPCSTTSTPGARADDRGARRPGCAPALDVIACVGGVTARRRRASPLDAAARRARARAARSPRWTDVARRSGSRRRAAAATRRRARGACSARRRRARALGRCGRAEPGGRSWRHWVVSPRRSRPLVAPRHPAPAGRGRRRRRHVGPLVEPGRPVPLLRCSSTAPTTTRRGRRSPPSSGAGTRRDDAVSRSPRPPRSPAGAIADCGATRIRAHRAAAVRWRLRARTATVSARHGPRHPQCACAAPARNRLGLPGWPLEPLRDHVRPVAAGPRDPDVEQAALLVDRRVGLRA